MFGYADAHAASRDPHHRRPPEGLRPLRPRRDPRGRRRAPGRVRPRRMASRRGLVERPPGAPPLLRARARGRRGRGGVRRPPLRRMVGAAGVIYPELHAHSCFSFLDGASQPEEMAERAAMLGYETVALTDHDGLSGSLAFAHAAREAGIRAVTGAEITLAGGAHITLLAETAAGYRNLCRLITAAHAGDRRAPAATLDQVARHAEGLHCLSGCARHGLLARPVAEGRLREAEELGLRLRGMFGRDRLSIELQRPYARGDARRNRLLAELAG